jgi:hypothetical protein
MGTLGVFCRLFRDSLVCVLTVGSKVRVGDIEATVVTDHAAEARLCG